LGDRAKQTEDGAARSLPRLASALAVGLAIAALPASASAFEIVPQGCVREVGALAECAQSMHGLGGPAAVAVSPDGKSVYVASFSDDAIAHLQRDPSSGALTPVDCVADEGSSICGPGNSTPGLGGVIDVAVSPDGESVYAVSQGDDAIVALARDPVTGSLTPDGCIGEYEGSSGCPLTSVEGLVGADAIAISPDGMQIYVASKDDGAIDHFMRHAAISGDNTELLPPSPPGHQTCEYANSDHPPPGCTATADGLAGAQDLVVSPDGHSLYVASGGSGGDNAIARFDLDSEGHLIGRGCIADPTSGNPGCATQAGLDGARAVAISPDGGSVYVGGSGAVVVFERETGLTDRGALTGLVCVADAGIGGCASNQQGLGSVFDLAVSPDGESLYAVSFFDAALVRFSRDPANGVISGLGCVEDTGLPIGCGQKAEALKGNEGLAISPDGGSVYVAALSDNALSRFDRVSPAPPPAGGGSPPRRSHSSRAPPLTVRARRVQRLAKLAIRAACGPLACRVLVGGAVRVKQPQRRRHAGSSALRLRLRRLSARVAAGKSMRLAPRLGRRAARRVEALLERRARAVAVLSVTAVGVAGRSHRSLRIRLRP
jgi:DNA-binding beta-propeller fold protein YncE